MLISMSSKTDFSKDLEQVTELLSLTYDAHCHYHLAQSEGSLKERDELIQTLQGATLMSTERKDWDRVFALTDQSSHIRYALGVHPWFAHRYAGRRDWLDDLEKRLRQDPLCSVGEIGLDRKWRTPDTGVIEYEAQLEVFHAQLKLAGEHARPVSIHCVHAQGDLYQALDQCSTLPPSIYLHAFGGAAGTAEQLLRSRRFGERLYFGFAACVNLRSPKTRSVIEVIPKSRLLIESDRSEPWHVRQELIEMLSVYQEIKGWKSLENTARKLTENAIKMYSVQAEIEAY